MAGPIAWQLATVTGDPRRDADRPLVHARRCPAWPGHRPGQHVDLRLTAEDGYSVERSYSIASEPERAGEIDITVERIEDGEVSPFLHDVVVPGDRLEVRGPIGGYFVWEAALGGPLLLVAGGSGVVPLMAMVRHRARAGSRRPDAAALQLARPARRSSTATSSTGWRGRGDGLRGRPHADPVAAAGLDRATPAASTSAMLAEVARAARASTPAPTSAGRRRSSRPPPNALVRLGLPPDRVRTERFGPTGT